MPKVKKPIKKPTQEIDWMKAGDQTLRLLPGDSIQFFGGLYMENKSQNIIFFPLVDFKVVTK